MANGKQPDFAVAYDDRDLECRYPNHHWLRAGVQRTNYDRRKVVVIQFKCKCGNIRTDVLGMDGERISSTINYSGNPQYLIKGKGRVDRSVWRREVVRRALAEE